MGRCGGADFDAAVGAGVPPKIRSVRVEDGLFPEEYPMITGEAAHQMLRPLINEVPTKWLRQSRVGVEG
jgi:hypothetical protein